MTTTTDNQTDPRTIFTARRCAQLTTAAKVLNEVDQECRSAAWNAPSDVSSDVTAQHWGRMSALADRTEDAIQDLLIAAEVYLSLPNLRG